jgi:Rod binding domain-containing protein
VDNSPIFVSDAKPVPATDLVKYREELHKVTKEFEGILLAKMFQAMRSTVERSDWMGDGYEQEIYEDMLFGELSNISARAESIGIAEMMFQSFTAQDAEGKPDEKQGPDAVERRGDSPAIGSDIKEVGSW